MNAHRLLPVAGAHGCGARVLVRVGVSAALLTLLSGSDCLPDTPPECRANCGIEAECDLRTLADCQANACDPLTGQPKDPAADACLAAAADCLEAAACACEGGCSRLDACAEAEPDPTCVSTCDTLVEQQPTQTYQENRCRIEATECSELATCSSVSG